MRESRPSARSVLLRNLDVVCPWPARYFGATEQTPSNALYERTAGPTPAEFWTSAPSPAEIVAPGLLPIQYPLAAPPLWRRLRQAIDCSTGERRLVVLDQLLIAEAHRLRIHLFREGDEMLAELARRAQIHVDRRHDRAAWQETVGITRFTALHVAITWRIVDAWSKAFAKTSAQNSSASVAVVNPQLSTQGAIITEGSQTAHPRGLLVSSDDKEEQVFMAMVALAKARNGFLPPSSAAVANLLGEPDLRPLVAEILCEWFVLAERGWQIRSNNRGSLRAFGPHSTDPSNADVAALEEKN